MATLSLNEIKKIGLKSFGKNLKISDKVSFYGASKITIGDNVRIDDYVVISAGEKGIKIGSHIHIAVFSSFIGAGQITIEDFCNFSSRVSVYSSNDDYSGHFMTNPMIPPKFTNVSSGPVHFGKHTIVGCGSVILPDVSIGEGTAIGALSLVKGNCKPFSIYSGVPARYIKKRSKKLLDLEAKFLISLKK